MTLISLADLLEIAGKVVLGTILFCIILVIARNGNIPAAGMMLTFPALNGLVLLTATQQHPMSIAAGIIPIILLNGLLCAAYIRTYPALTARLPSSRQSWLLAGAAFIAWVGAVGWLETGARGFSNHPFFSLAAAAAITVIGGAAICASRSMRDVPTGSFNEESMSRFLFKRRLRILIFAASLLFVLVVARLWTEESNLIGRLAALPLVPLFALVGIAESRPDQLDKMRHVVFVGALLAMIFVLVFSQMLAGLRSYTMNSLYWAFGLAGLVAGWVLCGGAIFLLSRASIRQANATT